MTAIMYPKGVEAVYRGDLGDIEDADLHVALLAPTHSPSVYSDVSFADVNADEISGTGYTAGGKPIPGVSTTMDDDRYIVNGGDVIWEDSSLDAGYAVIYDAMSSVLLALIEFDSQQSTVNADFEIRWVATPILDITADNIDAINLS